MPKIRELLAKLGLRLNEKKFYLQHYSKGVEFTGSIVKPIRPVKTWYPFGSAP